MQVLVVDAYDHSHTDAHVAEQASHVLTGKGHTVETLHLHDLGFLVPMSPAERQAYPSGTPLVTDAAKSSAESVQRADALLFCYPTVLFGVPPVLKSWLERVLVEGVAFRFDAKGRLVPAMVQIKRIGALTTTPHTASTTRSARDLGRRTVLRTLRLNCHRFCRRTFVRLDTGTSAASAESTITNALRRW